MQDAGQKYTERELAALTRRFKAVYRQAQDEIIQKMNAHLRAFKAKDKAKRALLEAGKITKNEYDNWLTGQVFAGKQWRDKLDSVATSLFYANQQANSMIEGGKRAVFGENATFQAYKLENGMGMDLSFSVYDSATVTQLIKKQPELLPRKVVNGVKDKAWNRTKIAHCITQGIIQGESIQQIADRMARDTASQNQSAMIRYARTAMTGAQNAGRMEMLHEAQDMGIKVKKKWLATLDSRTRDSHAYLDGQVQDVDKPFHSLLGEIMYPGDPSAHPGDVWGCRCALIYEYPEYMPKDAQRGAYKEWADENGEKRREYKTIPDMTYKEWRTGKKQEKEKPTNIFGDAIDYSQIGSRHREQIEIIDDLASEFRTKLKEVRPGSQKSAGSVQISGTIMMLSDASLSTAIHEFAHTISFENQTKFGLYEEGDFWKEIKRIRSQYKKAVGETTQRWISVYEHSNRSADEFMAEAFTQAYMHEKGIDLPGQYGTDYYFSSLVLATIRKYFSR